MELFDLHRELYDGVDFIRILPELAKNHDAEVGNLLVRLSKDAHWEGDAPSYLQLATATYAGQHTKTFVSVIDQLSPSEQGNLITFLADVQNHSAYGEYQTSSIIYEASVRAALRRGLRRLERGAHSNRTVDGLERNE